MHFFVCSQAFDLFTGASILALLQIGSSIEHGRVRASTYCAHNRTAALLDGETGTSSWNLEGTGPDLTLAVDSGSRRVRRARGRR